MLYQLPILDVFLTAMCIVYFFRKTTSSLCDIDICVIILSILFFFAFLRKPNNVVQKEYAKFNLENFQ